MVANPDHASNGKGQDPQVIVRNECAVLRGSSRFFGGVLVLASIGIWAVPVGAGDAGMVLMKLLVSVCLACVGALLVEAGRPGGADEVHMDTERRELRHIHRNCRGRQTLLARHDFADLADIRLRNGLLTVVSTNGAVVLQLPMETVDNMTAIQQILSNSPAKAV